MFLLSLISTLKQHRMHVQSGKEVDLKHENQVFMTEGVNLHQCRIPRLHPTFWPMRFDLIV